MAHEVHRCGTFAPPAHWRAATTFMENLMRTANILPIVCSLIFISTGLAWADCVPRTIDGKKYTCCTKSTTKSLGCDDKNAKPGETLKCGNKTETQRECTEVVEKKDDKKTDKKDDKKSGKPADKKTDKPADKKSDKQADKKSDSKK